VGLAVVLAAVGSVVVLPRPAVAAAGEVLSPEQVALAQARSTGQAVDVPALTTETTTVKANPDGTFTAEIHGGPTRFKDASGGWRTVDLTLEARADGTVAPRAHPRGLVLSGAAGAGEHALATLGVDGKSITLGWDGVLPQPTLSGTIATYANVLPNIDLQVQVTRTGFEQLLVVKDRAAVALVAEVRMPLGVEGLSSRPADGGGLEFTDGAGEVVASVPAARMWDAKVSAQTGEHGNQALVQVRVDDTATVQTQTAQTESVDGVPGSTDLVVVPDAGFLADASTAFPVTIDPGVTWKPGYDAFIENTYSSDQSGATELKLGYSDDASGGCGSGCTARSLMRFDNAAAYAGSTVLSANLYLYETWSWSCTAAYWQAWSIGWPGTSHRWSNQPPWYSKVGESNTTKGYSSSCGDGWVAVDVKASCQKSISLNWSGCYIGLRAASETNHSGWKKFQSSEAANDPYISMTYNRSPNTPTSLKVQGKACGTSAVSVSTTAGQPNVDAIVSDPDGSERNVTAQYYLAAAGSPMPATPTVTKTVTGSTTGNAATVPIPSSFVLVEGKTYVMQVNATDGVTTGATSAQCSFIIDNGSTDEMPLVTVANNTYPEGLSGGGPGVSAVFTIAPPTTRTPGAANITKYRYSLSYNGTTIPWTELTPQSENGSVSFTWTPSWDDGNGDGTLASINRGGQLTVLAELYYKTGRWSIKQRSYQSTVASSPDVVAHWTMNDPASQTYLKDETGHFDANRYGSMVKSSDNYGDFNSSWTFDGTNTGGGAADEDYAEVASPIDSSRAFTLSAWVNLDAYHTADRIFLSKVGANAAGNVYMMYRAWDNKWGLHAPITDAAGTVTGWTQVISQSIAQPGVWTHLAGIYDPATGSLSLYVNGKREAIATGVKIYPDSNDKLRIGAGDVNYWHGQIDEVAAWQRVLDPREFGPLVVAERASWDMNGSLADEAGGKGLVAPYNLSTYINGEPVDAPTDESDATWPQWWSAQGHGADAGSTIGDGTRNLQTTNSPSNPVIRTDQSFSVSAWVHLEQMPLATGAPQTFISQDGLMRSSFFLGTRTSNNIPSWVIVMQDLDDPASAATLSLASPITGSQVGLDSDENAVFVHLVVVFDANARTVTLYVNGAPAGSATRTARWASTGPFAIGRGRWSAAGDTEGHPTDYVTGRTDEVRVYQGVLTDDMVHRLHGTLDGVL